VAELVNGKVLDHFRGETTETLSNPEERITIAVIPQVGSQKSCTAGALVGVIIPPLRMSMRAKCGT